ncbi:putative transcriptional regulatory protein [Clavispora lusitaniae]|uniref:Transcriptional regulatory protein n=1 Tax=Clavispora lusitaniae TaxID=36911 RepID=A0ACD0WCQ6_CLALS|nr:putative transcriptional regulatory protein [Clavispora lusitaniae]QFZ31388.1 putative transcriptional regulatory protein [Clavispora lusitaniae]QFZ37056.1 putative transcriptional regulatory protein [Clavispora lusitaniae]QFZ42740.1 putative transcriptional regulatory protein [Clavispora lusitaniae]QFZ48416.1 putative transcriptional regulatory protein [Clavispora lusitaniae]
MIITTRLDVPTPNLGTDRLHSRTSDSISSALKNNMANESSDPTPSASPPSKNFSRTPTSWDASDDVLLMHLKDNQKLGWKEIASHFHNRTPNACQFRWRRLKSGNLKNPPKSAAAIGSLAATSITETPSPSQGPGSPAGSAPKKAPKRRKSETPTSSLAPVYSPLANTTFTGYDTVSTALAGLSALSSTSGASVGSQQSGLINTTSHPQTFDNSPKSDVALDPQTHSAAAAGTSGGYFTDISVDPTSNLPHNRPHPVPMSSGLTPRSSNVDQHTMPIHNNSIIQIVRDDRTSVSSQSRHSMSSLPSNSMNIPHHQSNNNALAHLPVLFGGNSISGPSRNTSISGPTGLPHLASTLSSIRNGSIVGPPQAYLRRSSMSVVHTERRGSEKDVKNEKSKVKEQENEKESGERSETPKKSASTQPIFKLPWSMEEDELLINRRRKELSFAELSILLPQRTEGEIWARIDALERLRNGHRASMSRENRRRRQSSLGLDDVDDFYSEVDSVIGAIDSDEDDEDEDALLDVDDSIPGQMKRARKRRASSAVNPLSVRDNIRRRLH